MYIDLEAPNGAFIKLSDPDLWYYLRSGNETSDVVINYDVTLESGESETRESRFPIEAIENFATFDASIYEASSYDFGYEILQQNGEGIALEAPNPEAEESTFCLYNAQTQLQSCATLTGYSVLRTDLENIRNNSERHYAPSDYACSDNSCQAMPGVQNVVFGGEGLLAFFKDSTDNQYYKASADLETFMMEGDAALTVTPVVNGAGESEIVAATASLVDDIQREVDVSRLSPFEYDFDSNQILINYGLPLSEVVELPNIGVTLDGTGEALAVVSRERSLTSTDTETVIEYALVESALALSGGASVDLLGAFFVKDSPLRFGWNGIGGVILGESANDDNSDPLLGGDGADDGDDSDVPGEGGDGGGDNGAVGEGGDGGGDNGAVGEGGDGGGDEGAVGEGGDGGGDDGAVGEGGDGGGDEGAVGEGGDGGGDDGAVGEGGDGGGDEGAVGEGGDGGGDDGAVGEGGDGGGDNGAVGEGGDGNGTVDNGGNASYEIVFTGGAFGDTTIDESLTMPVITDGVVADPFNLRVWSEPEPSAPLGNYATPPKYAGRLSGLSLRTLRVIRVHSSLHSRVMLIITVKFI
jgi:hypothetical protein